MNDAVFCVRRPWSEEAECLVCALDGDLGVPAEVKAAGSEYFLEAHVAKEVLEVFGEKAPSPAEVLRLLIHYAEYDAYPDWVYRR